MSYLKENEQIRIESVEQLKRVYEVLKEEWSQRHSFDDDIDMLKKNPQIECYVRYLITGISLHTSNIECISITFEQFMSRVNPEPKTETTIIESTDGKKYEVIMIREVEEPLNFWKWAEQNAKGLTTNENIEDYVRYRFNLGL